jgi:phosphopantetheine--protein transferase-like protein
MEEKIKEIVSVYTKIHFEEIGSSTIIDRSAVNSSIMLHRMYAKLAEQGFLVQDYWDVKNFGSLLQRINGKSNNAGETPVTVHEPAQPYLGINEPNARGIGIDIEEIDSMPEVNDFREEVFYKMNFSASEIAYCILQPSPYASFAGLFAAKEALVKADSSYKNKAFNTIVIEHTETGKPSHHNFNLSIAHTKTTAVAVAIPFAASAAQLQPTWQNQSQSKTAINFYFSFSLVLVSLLLSLIAIYLVWKRN